jgi:hypothetical protein
MQMQMLERVMIVIAPRVRQRPVTNGIAYSETLNGALASFALLIQADFTNAGQSLTRIRCILGIVDCYARYLGLDSNHSTTTFNKPCATPASPLSTNMFRHMQAVRRNVP